MEIVVGFPGDSRVDAQLGPFTIKTDQPPANTAPSPFMLFLASIGTCAGFYVLRFCQQRELPTEGIRVIERVITNPQTHVTEAIELEIQVPPAFPEKYYDALVNSADLCAVKRALENPPSFKTFTKVIQS